MDNISLFLEELATKYDGISKEKIELDITSKLKIASVGDITILEKLSFKEAKKEFRKRYITRILIILHGNVSETAKALDVNRRTLHRNIKELGIDVNAIKNKMEKTYIVKKEALNNMLDTLIKTYEKEKSDTRKEPYANIDGMASFLAENRNFEILTLKFAENIFEKKYYSGLLKGTENIRDIALKSNTNYEKLTQKIKKMKKDNDFL